MVLQRQGNKKALFKKIDKYIPKHEIYIEPFFGAGGIFFLKEKARYNFLNDLDNEVFNLFQVIKNKPVQFKNLLQMVPKVLIVAKCIVNVFHLPNQPCL